MQVHPGVTGFIQALQETVHLVRGGQKVERTVQRAAARVPCVLTLNVMGVAGRTVNVSASGMRLWLPRALVTGFNYPLEMQNAAGQKLAVEVRVVWSLPSADGSGYDAGCEFADFGELTLDQIIAFFQQVPELGTTQPQPLDSALAGTPLIYTAPDGRVRKALATGFSTIGIEITSRVGEDAGSDVDVFVQFSHKPFRAPMRIVESRRAEDGVFFKIRTEFKEKGAWQELKELLP
ncbi:MAG: PilZ domain-containing protein [Candidatus Xenobia bacterium]